VLALINHQSARATKAMPTDVVFTKEGLFHKEKPDPISVEWLCGGRGPKDD
jgi:hypothetical protein